MITHFAELELQTVSVDGVKQVYADHLGFPIEGEEDQSVTFAITPHTTLRFVEQFEPIAPAHFAFQVSYRAFFRAVDVLKEMGVLVISEVRDSGFQRVLYFRDGDGNILEIIAFDYIPEDVLPALHPLQVLYLREVGFPVKQVAACRKWMASILDLKKSDNSSPQFGFMVGGTSHAVVVDQMRPWIPIGMRALPPPMRLVWGTPSLTYLGCVRKRLRAQDVEVTEGAGEITFGLEEYQLGLRHTPEFSADIPARLRLPEVLDQ